MNRVEQLLHTMYNAIIKLSTGQELTSAIKVLEVAAAKILDPELKMDELKPPQTNTNRKGRKSKPGAKCGTQRLKIQIELFQEQQLKEIKKKEKKEELEEEIAKKKRMLL